MKCSLNWENMKIALVMVIAFLHQFHGLGLKGCAHFKRIEQLLYITLQQTDGVQMFLRPVELTDSYVANQMVIPTVRAL